MIEEARRILVNATRGEMLIDAIELSHPAIAEVVKITPFYPGIGEYQHVPMSVEKPANTDRLTQQYKIIIQDLNPDGSSNGLNGIVSGYLDQIPIDTEEPIVMRAYSLYVDRDGNYSVADGPYSVEVGEFSSEPQGVGFTAEPQAINVTKCGERGTIDRTGGLYRQFT